MLRYFGQRKLSLCLHVKAVSTTRANGANGSNPYDDKSFGIHRRRGWGRWRSQRKLSEGGRLLCWLFWMCDIDHSMMRKEIGHPNRGSPWWYKSYSDSLWAAIVTANLHILFFTTRRTRSATQQITDKLIGRWSKKDESLYQRMPLIT